MSVELIRRLINVKEYHIMAESGILTEEDRIELLNGEIVCMSPIGSKHVACVNRIINTIAPVLNGKAILSAQNPIIVDDLSEPEPDFAILKPKDDFYENLLATSKDVYLIIEVSDSTLAKDREIKLPLYASSGIPETWIINLEKNEIEVYREPKGNTYQSQTTVAREDTLEIKALSISFSAKKILG